MADDKKVMGSLALMRAAAATAVITDAGAPANPLTDAAPRVTPRPAIERGEDEDGDGCVTTFLERHYLHYNAGTVKLAAQAWKQHVEAGGAMMLTLAGAMSTAQLGRSIAPLIRAGFVHMISCTGANLEEDVMNLIGRDQYEDVSDYKEISPEDDEDIYDEGANRVTDTTIPDKVMVPLAKAVMAEWRRLDKAGQRAFPHEVLYKILRTGALEKRYVEDPNDSWLLAAMESHLPIVVPGWEDSTLGNNYCAACLQGTIRNIATVRSGIEYMADLAAWYATTAEAREIGFFQVGGGIAGDFPICVVPMLHEELQRDDLPKLAYFAQVTDAHESYGGYSGASPSEKITWGKLDRETKRFDIHSDATLVFPLIAAYLLGW
jgi:deoxyhypusine synthase